MLTCKSNVYLEAKLAGQQWSEPTPHYSTADPLS